MNSKPTVYLIRGWSGSGKSTLALHLASALNAVHCEADQYWYKPDGTYRFDATRLQAAHNYCYCKFLNALNNNSNVVVSDTFIHLKDLRPYTEELDRRGITPNIVVAASNFNNIHEVSAAKVKIQKTSLLSSLNHVPAVSK
jgi:uridine kinase